MTAAAPLLDDGRTLVITRTLNAPRAPGRHWTMKNSIGERQCRRQDCLSGVHW